MSAGIGMRTPVRRISRSLNGSLHGFQGHARHLDDLVAAFLARDDAEGGDRHPQPGGKELEQGLVRLSLQRGGLQSDLHRAIVKTRHLTFAGPGLYADGNPHTSIHWLQAMHAGILPPPHS